MITTTLAVLAAFITLPVALLLWASESRPQRARRWRRAGLSYRAIADRLAVSPSTARRYCLA